MPTNDGNNPVKMDVILDLATHEIIAVLSEALPALSDDWWNLFVLDQLTSNQARHLQGAGPNLESLDLAAALRVLTRNFISISTKRDLSRDCKNFAFQVIDIRNRYAHRTTEAISPEDVYRDIDTLERFLTLLKASKATIRSVNGNKQSALLQLAGTDTTPPPTGSRPTQSQQKTPSAPKEENLKKKDAISLCQKEIGVSIKPRDVTYSNVNAASGNWWFEPSVDAFRQDRYFLLNDQGKNTLYLFKVPAHTYSPPDNFFYVRPDSDRCQIYVSPADTDHFADIHPSGPGKVKFSNHLLQRVSY